MISGILFATLFWVFSGIGNSFHLDIGGSIFLYLLFGISVVGTYFGAGIVGWRLTDRYYHPSVKYFIKRYELYSALSLAILAVVIYSPIPFLAFLWCILAPFCVLMALPKSSKPVSVKI
ncbi:MAG: hypothetical protein ABSB12_00060 [Candidatus Saccharimonadales bacterium]|jgi:hypothetical protein